MTRRHLKLLGVFVLALSVTAALAAGDAAAKKKKKGKTGGTVDITKAVNAPVPDATATGMTLTSIGTLTSTIDVGGKQFKGAKIRDVNVTIQTLGAIGGVGGSLSELDAAVTAPNGATVFLFGTGLFGASLGPLTIDDETPSYLTFAPPPSRQPAAVASPYQGTAQPYCFFARGGCTLSEMDNGPVTGTWTLRVYDQGVGAGNTSIVTNWRIVAQAGKAFLTK